MIITIECDVKELTALLELKSQSAGEAPLPFLGHLSMSDLEELALARREKAHRDKAETRRLYNSLAEQSNQYFQAK